MEKITKNTEKKPIGVTGILNKVDDKALKSFIDMMNIEEAKPAQKKEKQFAIAAIVLHPTNESKFLAVKRPPDAKSLPDVWGLPAITLRRDESPEMAVARLASEKLDTQVEILGWLGVDSRDRGRHELTLMDVIVRIVGKEPSVYEAHTEQTKYVQQQWTDDLFILQEAASKGSICSTILLQTQGIKE